MAVFAETKMMGPAGLAPVRRVRRPAFAAAAIRMEATIARPVALEGIGLHGGVPARLVIHPAAPGTGIVFHRVDLGPDARLSARYDHVADTRLCTLLADPAQPALRIGTVEHLMAALAATGIDNALVAVDGPEIPILDGSSRPFVALLATAGRATSDRPCRPIVVRRPVRVADRDGDGFASLLPADRFAIDLSIDFDADAIGRQSILLDQVTPEIFRDELADARTFALAGDIARLHAAGLARGGSLENAVVVDGARVLNPEGLRMRDEFVRHKALDAVGDLALAGRPIRGRFVAHRAGHGLNNRVLHALFADPSNWSIGDEKRAAA